MKFKTYAHKIVPDHQPNFHKDLCKDARARGINTRTRDEMRAHAHSILYPTEITVSYRSENILTQLYNNTHTPTETH